MSATLKPVAPSYLEEPIEIRVGDRLHRVIARLLDTHMDDLTDTEIERLEEVVDEMRVSHASGRRFAGEA